MRQKTFWIAFSLGMIAGGVTAILLAPQSGAMTRRKLRRGVEDLSDNLQDAGDYLKEQAERLSKEAQKLINTSKEQFGSAVDTASGYMKTANKAVQSVSRLM
ncbi:MAG TPA: YtxH domain-containing protein [Acidobacteriaceae bacterium]|jgi:gas vesicle protein